MDTITHSLLGAVVVRSAFPARQSTHPFSNRQRLLAGAVAGAFPDIDYIASWVDPMVYFTLWHRSITHSFVLLPLWALLLGYLLSRAFRQRDEWRYLTLLAGVSVLSHIASDLITVYGTQVLAPLSAWRASIGTTFIIDPWFSLIVLAGFVAGFSNTSSDMLPRASLAVLLGYLLLQGVLRQQALSLGQEYVQREDIPAVRIAVFPQPFSPFNWKIVIESGDYYDIGYTSLSGGYAEGKGTGFWEQVRDTYRAPARMHWRRQGRFGEPGAEAVWVEQVWGDSRLDDFSRFAELPVLYRIDRNGIGRCVWFTDLRYVLPYMTPPFRYGLCRAAPDSGWELRRLRD